MTDTANTYTTRFVRLRGQTGNWLVDPRLRPALVAYATERGYSMTSAAVEILADALGVRFVVVARKTTPKAEADELNLRLPKNVDAALIRKAIGKSVPNVITDILTERLLVDA